MERLLRTRWWLLAALTAVLAFGLVACGGDDDDDDDDGGNGGGDVSFGDAKFGTVTINAGQPIKIGYSGPITGDLAGIGVPIQNAVELAASEREIKGFKVEVISKDDGCNPTGGKSAADQLVSEGVVAVVGPVCSGAVVASQDTYEGKGITQISPSSTAINVTSPDRGKVYKTFLRTTYSDAIQGPAQAEFAYNKLGAKTAYIVFDTDAYGSGLRDSFRDAFEDLGGQIKGSPEGFAKGATDFQSIVTNIQNEKPDIVYFAGFYSEATPFIKQLRAANKDIKFLAGDGVKNDEFVTGAGADAEGTYQSLPSPVYEGNAYKEFGDKFEAKYDFKRDSSPYVAEAYDAVTIILNALEKVAVEKDGKLEIDTEKLNEEIRKTTLEGASGTIRFDERGDNVGGEVPVSLFLIKDGKYEEVPK